MTSPGDHRPTASLEMLELRARLLATMRRFFDERGYFEVDTPLLSHDRVVDPHLEPFIVEGAAAPLYLQTSPEFGMKRLLAAGARAIYQIGHVFRAHELGRLHNPEFTMVEWYRAGDTHVEQMQVVQDLVVESFRDVQRARSSKVPVPQIPFSRTTYREAFERYTGSDVFELTTGQLVELARTRGVSIPASFNLADRDDCLNLLLAELVEPHLGRERPEFLYDYPASQAAIARIRSETPAVAERFELYSAGIELCNGYHELTDPAELRRRMEIESLRRKSEGLSPLPVSSRLLSSMEAGLPACAGVALGFDRLLMLAAGAKSIAEVLPFAFDRA
jgi:lysyl-tRNA synthetase class 2